MKILTRRQAVILFCFLTIAQKLQRLPAIISSSFGRDGYLAFAVLFMADFLVLLAVLSIYNRLQGQTIFNYIKNHGGKFWLVVFCVLTIIFFMFKALLSFKQLHEFFANTLFNRLPWRVFSILFIALIVLMVANGLKNIARTGELYLYPIAISLIIVVAFGVFTGDFQRLLPVLDLPIKASLPKLVNYSGWFLDPVIILFFSGHIKEETTPVKPFILAQIACSLFVVFGMATFYAVNEYMVEFQSNGLTSMTEFTLIRLGVGRPDWFLVLFVNIANVVDTALLVWVVCESVSQVIRKRVGYPVTIGVLAVEYVLDEFVYKNLEVTVYITTHFASVFMLMYVVVVIGLLLILVKKQPTKEGYCEKGI